MLKIYSEKVIDPIFSMKVNLVVGSKQDFVDHNNKRGLTGPVPAVNAAGMFGVYTDNAGKRIAVIWLKEFSVTNLIHECVHAAYYIVESRKLIKDEEFIAYYTAFLSSKFIEICLKSA